MRRRNTYLLSGMNKYDSYQLIGQVEDLAIYWANQ